MGQVTNASVQPSRLTTRRQMVASRSIITQATVPDPLSGCLLLAPWSLSSRRRKGPTATTKRGVDHPGRNLDGLRRAQKTSLVSTGPRSASTPDTAVVLLKRVVFPGDLPQPRLPDTPLGTRNIFPRRCQPAQVRSGPQPRKHAISCATRPETRWSAQHHSGRHAPAMRMATTRHFLAPAIRSCRTTVATILANLGSADGGAPSGSGGVTAARAPRPSQRGRPYLDGCIRCWRECAAQAGRLFPPHAPYRYALVPTSLANRCYLRRDTNVDGGYDSPSVGRDDSGR
jgi:hypothetical protein